MAKPPVLGNDPFKRGAAERPTPVEPVAAAPEPAPAPVKKAAKAAPKPKAAAKQKPAPKAAKPKKAAAPKPEVRAEEPAPVEEIHEERHEEVVVEGELVDHIPPRPTMPPAGELPERAGEEPRASSNGHGGFFARAQAAVEGVLERVLASEAGQKVFERVSSSPLMQKAVGQAASAAMQAMPTVLAAAKALPPVVETAKSAVSAVASGEAAKVLLHTAAEAGEAARRVITRVEPPTFEVDAFGEDPNLNSRVEPIFDFLHDRYFRVETSGAENVPRGPCVLVCNHSGALPIDGPMIRTVLRKDCRRPDARWLVEDAIFHAPFLGVYLNRLGAVRACPENAEKLLLDGYAVAVFPEGLLGISKRFGERYKLQRFGRGGFVKLAMRMNVPIVPVAIVGAEESTPLVGKMPVASLGIPYVPVTPTFPFLGPLGLVPLPVKWHVHFLPPVDVGHHGPKSAEDLGLVAEYTAKVRDSMQKELDRILGERKSVFS